ncbi:hypothetical protein D9M72_334720 [compost metagenome]
MRWKIDLDRIALDAGKKEPSKNGACQRSKSPKERCENHFARGMPRQICKHCELKGQRFQCTSQAAEGGGKNERNQFITLRVVAKRGCSLLVLSDREKNLSERRLDDPTDCEDRNDDDGRDHVVSRQRILQVKDTEQHSSWNVLHTVFSLRVLIQRGLQCQEENQLTQRQGHHGKADAMAFDGDETKRKAQ